MLKNFLKITVVLSGLTLLVKILFFIKELIIAYYFGTSTIADSYNLILILPNIVLNTIAPSIGVLLISKIINRNEIDSSVCPNEINIFIGKREIKILSFLLIANILYNLIFLKYISVEYNTFFIVILSFLLPALYFIQVCLVYIFQAVGKFVIGSLSSIIQVIFSILIILFWPGNSNGLLILLFSLAWGLFIQLILLLLFVRKYKVKVLYEEEINEINLLVLIPTMFSVGLMEILFSITKMTAGLLDIEGKVSAINYAYKIFNLPLSILLTTIVSILFPQISKLEKKKELGKIKELNNEIIKFLLFLMLPIAILLYQNNYYVIKILFFRGNFVESSLNITSDFFGAIILSLPLVSVITMIIRVKLIEKSYKFLMYTSFGSVLLLGLLQIISIYIIPKFFDHTIFVTILIITIYFIYESNISIKINFYLKLLGINFLLFMALMVLNIFFPSDLIYANLFLDSILCLFVIFLGWKYLAMNIK